MKKLILIVYIFVAFISCNTNKYKVDESKRGLIVEQAMVVSAREEASKIGTNILKKGGNAFDAMAATQLALAVAYPYAGNIGGGGFMVYRKSNGEIGALDYREKAPLAATKDMYLDSLGNVIPEKSTLGAMAVGVPGSVAGVFAIHEKLGSLPIEDIIKPSIDLAKTRIMPDFWVNLIAFEIKFLTTVSSMSASAKTAIFSSITAIISICFPSALSCCNLTFR